MVFYLLPYRVFVHDYEEKIVFVCDKSFINQLEENISLSNETRIGIEC